MWNTLLLHHLIINYAVMLNWSRNCDNASCSTCTMPCVWWDCIFCDRTYTCIATAMRYHQSVRLVSTSWWCTRNICFCANCSRFLGVIARFYCKLCVNIRNILCWTYVFTDSYCQYHSTYFAFGSFCLELFVFLAVPRLAASDRLFAVASIIHCFEFLTDFSKISYSCLSKCQSLG